MKITIKESNQKPRLKRLGKQNDKEQNAELLAALNDLLDEQNDAPLETRRKEWESAMAKAREAIENAEKK